MSSVQYVFMSSVKHVFMSSGVVPAFRAKNDNLLQCSHISGRHRAGIYELDAKDVVEVLFGIGAILAALPRLLDTARTTIHTRIDTLKTGSCGETNSNRHHRVALDLQGTRDLLSIHVVYLCVHFAAPAGGVNLCQDLRHCHDGNSLTGPAQAP